MEHLDMAFLKIPYPSVPFLKIPYLISVPFLKIPYPSVPFLKIPYPSVPFLRTVFMFQQPQTHGAWISFPPPPFSLLPAPPPFFKIFI
jgi:hypothetical protein